MKRRVRFGRHDREELRSAVKSSEAVIEELPTIGFGSWGNGQLEPGAEELRDGLEPHSYTAKKEPCQ